MRKLTLLASFVLLLCVTFLSFNHHKTKETHHSESARVTKVKPSAEAKTMPTILSELKKSPKKTLKYHALGDSLSVGLFSNDQTTRFTTLFTKDLTKLTGRQVTEANTSMVGKTATNFGISHVQDVINDQPDLVTIEFDTNDAAYGIDETNVNNFVKNLDSIVQQVQSQTKAKIILVTTWSPSNGKYRANDQIYDQKIKAIAKKYHVPVADLSTIWKNNPDVTKNSLGYDKNYAILRDQFHPNQQGHDQIAKLLEKVIQQPEN